MRYLWMDEYLLNKRSVTKDLQPVWNWVRYHIGGKMFAALCLDRENQPYYITLKVDPAEGEFLRSQYPDIVAGYYCDKRNWISVKPDGAVPDALLESLLDNAYRLMLSSFSKKRQREILKLSCCGTDCASCPWFTNKCTGCNACQGKVFHAPPSKPCPIYNCAVQKHRYLSCGECEHLPCQIWKDVRDPQFSQQDFDASISQRISQLKEIFGASVPKP